MTSQIVFETIATDIDKLDSYMPVNME